MIQTTYICELKFELFLNRSLGAVNILLEISYNMGTKYFLLQLRQIEFVFIFEIIVIQEAQELSWANSTVTFYVRGPPFTPLPSTHAHIK